MMRKEKSIDLHIHSYFSDGMRGIEEIVKYFKKLGYQLISLTDHNNIAGVKKIIKLGKEKGIKIVPGVEIYARYKKYIIHLLGYNFKPDNNDLNQILKRNQEEEIRRVKKIISKFRKLGFKIKWQDIQRKIGSKFIDAGHIASILLDSKQNIKLLKKQLGNLPNSKKELIHIIIKEYISQNKPAWVDLACLDLKQIIKIIHKAGGFIVIAHPGQTFGYLKEKKLKDLIKRGVDGIEAISRHHLKKQNEYYLKLAKKYNIKITIGSDWHDYRDEKKALKIFSKYKKYINLKF